MLEGSQGGENGASDPYLVLTGGISNDLDLNGRGGQVLDFLLQTVINVGETGGTTGHDDVLEESLPDIDVTLNDGRMGQFVHALNVLADLHRLEESLRASDHLVAHGDDSAVREVEGLLLLG